RLFAILGQRCLVTALKQQGRAQEILARTPCRCDLQRAAKRLLRFSEVTGTQVDWESGGPRRIRVKRVQLDGLDRELPGLIPLAACRRQSRCGLNAIALTRAQGERLFQFSLGASPVPVMVRM